LNKIECSAEKNSLNVSINDEDIYDELLEDLEPETDLIH